MNGLIPQPLEEILREMDREFLSKQLKISVEDFYRWWKEGDAIVLDVRTPEEVELVKIGPSIHIPLNELPDRYKEVPDDKIVAIFCPGKIRAGIAYTFLRAKGYTNVKILAGGLEDLAALKKP